MKKGMVIFLLLLMIFGLNIKGIASGDNLIKKVGQELVLNTELTNQEINEVQSKLKKQIDLDIDSEKLLEVLENQGAENFVMAVNKIDELQSNKIPANYINEILEKEDINKLKIDKIIKDFKSSNSTRYNTRQLRYNADYRVNLSKMRPETGEMYWVPSNKLGMPDTTLEELKELKGNPKELQEEIDVLYEALAYIQVSKMKTASGNIAIYDDKKDRRWQFPASAEFAIKENKANCVGMTNVINYLLKDDYDEVGGFWYHRSFIIGDKKGGHVVNYIKHNDKYYIFDSLGYIHERDTYSSPENGETYHRGDKAGCIHEIANKDNGDPNFKPYIDLLLNYNSNIAFMVLVPMERFPVMGSSTASHNHDTDIFISDRADLDEIMKIYDNPDDPQVLIEEEVLVGPPEEYEDYAPYNSM